MSIASIQQVDIIQELANLKINLDQRRNQSLDYHKLEKHQYSVTQLCYFLTYFDSIAFLLS